MSQEVFNPNEIGEKIIDVIKTIYDPEIPVDVEDKVKTVKGIKSVEVEITFDPPWTQDLMSEEAKLELGIL